VRPNDQGDVVEVIETAARGAQFLLAIGIAYLVAMWFALVAWTFRDIEARSRSVFTQVFSTLLVVLFFIPGLLLYLILRPKETLDQAFQRALEEEYLLQDLDDLPLCPGCQRAVEADFVLCPHCQTQLRGPCPACSRLIDLRWSVCPYCAVPVDRSAAPELASGIDSARVLDTGRAGLHRRAVTAAAQRVGIESDELDALTDALSVRERHAVGAGDPVGASTGLSRRLASFGEFSRIRNSAWSKFGLGDDNSKDEGVDDGSPDAAQIVPSARDEEARFWADPLPATDRDADRTP
jgi:hypothetical protein